MPYALKGKCVHKQNADGSLGARVPGGCHKTVAEAKKHLAALYAAMKKETVTAAAPDHSTGMMVAVYPHPDHAAQLAIDHPNALSADELHCTLAYMGTVDEEEPDEQTISAVKFAMATVAQNHPQLSARIGGVGQFPEGPDGIPVFRPVDAPGINHLHVAVMQALADAGLPARTDHSFSPHLTLTYLKSPDMSKVKLGPPLETSFNDLVLKIGEQTYSFALTGPSHVGDGTPETIAPTIDGTIDKEPPTKQLARFYYLEGDRAPDGRIIDPGATNFNRPPPLPIGLQTTRAHGHDGAVISGAITHVARFGNVIVGDGFIDLTQESGRQLVELAMNGTMQTWSPDMGDAEIIAQVIPDNAPPDYQPDTHFISGTLLGAVVCQLPAMGSGVFALLNDDGSILCPAPARGPQSLTMSADAWRTDNEFKEDEMDYLDDFADISTAVRKKAAKSGEALPDGCLSGDTRVVTRQGKRDIKTLCGELELLTDRGWVKSEIRSFGEGLLDKVQLRRGDDVITVRATPNHRWLLRNGSWKFTFELQAGDGIPFVEVLQDVPDSRAFNPTKSSIASVAKQSANLASDVTVIDVQPRPLASVGAASNNGDSFTQETATALRSLHSREVLLRDAVLTTEDPVATSEPSLVSDLDGVGAYLSLNPDADLALGSTVFVIPGIELGMRLGLSTEAADNQTLVIERDSSDLSWCSERPVPSTSSTVVMEFAPSTSQDRVAASFNTTDGFVHGTEAYPIQDWVVESVGSTTEIEEVFCAVVPELHRFVIEDGLLTGNSFPIRNKQDLMNARRAVGRANPSDRAKVKAHIRSRAKALGVPLPKDFSASTIAACAGPSAPPAEWFEQPDDPQRFINIEDSGRVSFLLAEAGGCHIGYKNMCITPPADDDFSYFHHAQVKTDDGELIATGPVALRGGHAPEGFSALRAQAHYDDVSTGIMDVRVGYDDEGNIWGAGALRSNVTENDIARLRASGVSGDWREIDGQLRLIGICSVNTPGFPKVRLAASAEEADAQVLAIIGMGTDPDYNEECEDCFEVPTLEERVEALESENTYLREVIASAGLEDRLFDEMEASLDA